MGEWLRSHTDGEVSEGAIRGIVTAAATDPAVRASFLDVLAGTLHGEVALSLEARAMLDAIDAADGDAFLSHALLFQQRCRHIEQETGE